MHRNIFIIYLFICLFIYFCFASKQKIYAMNYGLERPESTPFQCLQAIPIL